jgi:hypothetical protein
MKPSPLKFLLLRGFLFLIIGLILWVYLQPSYSKLLVSVSQEMSSFFLGKGEEQTSIRLQGNMILYIPLGLISSEKKGILAGRRDIREIHYNSVILFALIFFSPGLGFRKRGLVLMAGLVLLFFMQVLTVLVQAKFLYVFQLGEYSRAHYGAWDRNIYAFLKQFFELIGRFSFPFAIWMLFTYRETVEYLVGAKPERRPPKRRKK